MAKDRWNIEHEDEAGDEAVPAVPCWLCGRDLGDVTELHHPIPKSRGGKGGTVPLHPICHRTIHANFTNAELSRMGEDLFLLQANPSMEKFLRWVANKDPDFNAPTYGEGGKGGGRRR